MEQVAGTISRHWCLLRTRARLYSCRRHMHLQLHVRNPVSIKPRWLVRCPVRSLGLLDMALVLPSSSPKGCPLQLSSPVPQSTSFKTSFVPLTNSSSSLSSLRKTRTTNPIITASYSVAVPIKIVRCPALDRHATKHNRLRFVRKLTTLLLSKPRGFLPLRVLSRCRAYLSVPRSRSLLSMVLRYPAVFRLFHAPSHTAPSLSLLSVALTPAAAALAADEAQLRSRMTSSLAAKLQRFLMLAGPHHRLLLSKLAHLAPDLGLPPDFRSRLCNSHPDRFRTVDTSYGRALELVSRDPSLVSPLPSMLRPADGPIIDRPPKFKHLRLRRGLNLKRRHLDYLIRLQEMPAVDPYSPPPADGGPVVLEKRACAAVREVLGMTMEKRTLVDHLTHFRNELGLPNRLRAMLVRHPEMFYVSVKGLRDSVFLVEAYDDKGQLLVEDELLQARERLVGLVREGKRMRRERRMGVGYDDEDDDSENENADEEEVEGDGLDDLFVSGFEDDWEELQLDGLGVDGEEEEEIQEFWITRAAEGSREDGLEAEAW